MSHAPPAWIEPRSCPRGIVLRVILDTGEVIIEQTMSMFADAQTVDDLATAGSALMEAALDQRRDVDHFTLAGYDGDDGHLILAAEYGTTGEP